MELAGGEYRTVQTAITAGLKTVKADVRLLAVDHPIQGLMLY
jgi:hypothetical protein